MREELEDFFKKIAPKLEKEEAILRLVCCYSKTIDEATKEYDKWRSEWCNPLINKEF
ncbi:hypothetical protein JJB75_16465 [Clostridium perfringens]|uniref:hypothetical protein n=1 Tax=Clostridium perfringens TaxID=1502 RepID=UPI001ABB176D|nr:hypothetical protein [Clostridium perfringens]MBO3304676.1 hypothetical protein [Clostridium perfringens]MBO3308000.1 hypothetical protein [Clostridium perfringens]MBO3311334.1 hypothetical protein [Clostridium perfringens]MBO3317669.1 hypothetical protein [Clostridium perfringens]MBO3392778.1 hypothetical protein [Clostridium perfringens]